MGAPELTIAQMDARESRSSLRASSWGPLALDLAIGIAVVLFVAGPALFTNYAFAPEYVAHLWLVWHQQANLADHGLPSLYVHTQQTGLFVPFYGFYGGTLYTATAYLGLLLGSADAAFGLVITAGVASAYGGMLWLGGLLGVRRVLRHVPAIVFVTSAYYVTDIYARGAWPEFVALSALPVVAAGAARLTTAPWTAPSVSAFAAGCIAISGSHNISLLWYAILLFAIGATALVAVRADRPPMRRILSTVALACLAGAFNAWFLLFDVANASKTFIGVGGFDWHATSGFNTVDALLTPLRTTPAQSTTPGLVVAAPVLALAVAVVLYAVAQPRAHRDRPLGALWWVVMAGFVGTLLLAMSEKAWEILGSPFTFIQFPYRLAGWMAFAVAVLLAISLRLASRSSRALTATLVVGLLLVTAVQASAQLWGPTARQQLDAQGTHRDVAFVNGERELPQPFRDSGPYRDRSQPVVAVPEGRVVRFPTPEPGAGRLAVTVPLPAGNEPIATNVGTGPYAVRFDGADVIGRTDDGYAVLQPREAAGGEATITVTADTGAIGLAGIVITAISAGGLILLVGYLAWRTRRT